MGQVYEGGVDETCASDRAPIVGATGRRFGYQPALDGVRGLAVAMVVVFHLDTGFLTGGYLGVSVFFTLSGFLITTLLVERFHHEGDLGLGGFYVRRIRRLVPASAATLLAIAVITAGGGFLVTDRSSGDLVAAALNVFNWREVASGRAYADLFSGHSPVSHFWSLAIEEQFYVVWPIALLVLLRSRRVGPSRLLGAVAVLFLASAIAAQFGSANVAYFASWTRAAEILAGAGLAVWLVRAGAVPTWWRHLAAPALGLLVLLGLVTPAATGWAYGGGLPVFSLVSVALIAGLQVPGPVRSALSTAPLVGLGRISYGVYLVHWPVFVFVDEARMGVDGGSLVATRLGLTAVISLVMYFVLERPIRLTDRRVSVGSVVASAVAASLVIVAVALSSIDAPPVTAAAPAVLAAPSVPPPGASPDIRPSNTAPSNNNPLNDAAPPARPIDTMEADTVEADTVKADTEGADTGPADSEVETAADPGTTGETQAAEATPDGPTTIAVFGDSVPAWLMRDAAFAFARRDVVLVNGAQEACDGAVDLPVGRDRRGAELRPPEGCLEWTLSYPATLASYDRPVEVGLLVIGQALTVDRRIDGEWIHPCESSAWYLDDVRERIEFLRSQGVQPVVALPARFGTRADFVLPDDYNDRMACARTSLAAVALEQHVPVVDLDGLLCIGDDCDGRRVRDGVHVDPEVAVTVLDDLVDLTLAAR